MELHKNISYINETESICMVSTFKIYVMDDIKFFNPKKPNEFAIKKYYEFINNLPIFLPVDPMGKTFLALLDKYPVKPYLDSRKAFMKWNHL